MMLRVGAWISLGCALTAFGCGGGDGAGSHDDGDAGAGAMAGLDAGLPDAGLGGGQGQGQAAHDVDRDPLPKIVVHDVVELSKVARIARFRSGIGHDYADSVEHCRSMKHYFQPGASVDWSSVRIDAPFAGTVVRLEQEWAGKQVHVRSAQNPAFTAVIFHVQTLPSLMVGSSVEAGQQLGSHVGSQTMSDVAVQVNTPTGFRLVSYFDLTSDAVMERYRARGIVDPRTLIIDRAERDAAPLQCMGEAFETMGSLPNWVELN